MAASKREGENVSIDEKRAQWEGFDFGVTPRLGKVNVANVSYGASEAKHHTYTVTVEAGEVIGCTCPHATHRGAHCKHQHAVEDRPAVLAAATISAARESQQ